MQVWIVMVQPAWTEQLSVDSVWYEEKDAIEYVNEMNTKQRPGGTRHFASKSLPKCAMNLKRCTPISTTSKRKDCHER